MTVAVLNAQLRPLLEARLPEWVDARWYSSKEEAVDLAPEAEIAWFDMHDKVAKAEAVRRATCMRWLNSIAAGVDSFPLDLLRERGVIFTNGAGINAVTIAEYVVMGMLNIAKGYRAVMRAQDRHEWLRDSPGKRELQDSRALVLGYGAIGQLIDARLAAFGVDVVKVRRSPGAGTLGPNEWRAHLGTFDWVILAVPATAETEAMIGAPELAAMKPDAVLINIARGSVVDQTELMIALRAGQIGGAFLDVTTPEPLPSDDPLWDMDNVHLTMHLSGLAQSRMFERSAERFLTNLERWRTGQPVAPQVDLTLGY
ncbi:MAG: D-2-hydroxyacid dehydrogenase [Novosphingobium sp.]|uniref:D-2-hydroxyacid dehydrogenase n=1 Tax=Novosphingobium sp. TaxID=1874826 RepID=UPI0032B71821